MLKSILHTKTADALVKAPARLLSMEYDHWTIDEEEDIDHPVDAYSDSLEQCVDPQCILYGDQFDECI